MIVSRNSDRVMSWDSRPVNGQVFSQAIDVGWTRGAFSFPPETTTAVCCILNGGAGPSSLSRYDRVGKNRQNSFNAQLLTPFIVLRECDDGEIRGILSPNMRRLRRITFQLTHLLRLRSSVLIAHWWGQFPRKIRLLARKAWPPVADSKRFTHHPGTTTAGGWREPWNLQRLLKYLLFLEGNVRLASLSSFSDTTQWRSRITKQSPLLKSTSITSIRRASEISLGRSVDLLQSKG